MNINTSYPVRGWQEAQNLLIKGAREINRGEIIGGYLNMIQAVRSGQANLAVLKVEDELLGTVLDIFG